MKVKSLAFFFLPFLLASSLGLAQVETVVKTEVSGESANVKTEIVNIANDKEVKVESDQPGEIKVEIKNGEVKVESEGEASPTVTINEGTDDIQIGENKQPESIREEIKKTELEITNFLKKVFSRLQNFLSSWFGASS